MKNNILIIVVVTLVAIGVIAAVILAGLAKGTGGDSDSDSIPNWGGSSGDISSDYSSVNSYVSGSVSEESSSSSSQESSSASTYFVPDYSGKPAYSSTPASAGSAASGTSSPGGEFSAAEGIVATASSLIGVPFVMGGNNSNGFDNPGFIYYVLRENGFHNCSHSIEKQSKMGRKLEYSELKAGDLVFFYNEANTAAGFGGIYVGDGKMVACLTPSNREAGVMSADITTPYYRKKFCCGVSLS